MAFTRRMNKKEKNNPVMAGQVHSEVDKNIEIKSEKMAFNWNIEVEKNLSLAMINLPPNGLQKHLKILLLQEYMKKKYDIAIPTSFIWEYLNSNYDIENPDILKNLNLNFDNIQKSLCLSSYPAENEILNKHIKILNQSIEKEREILKLNSNVSTLPKIVSNSTSKIEYKDKISKKSLSAIDHHEKNIDEPTQIEVAFKNSKKARQTKNLKNKKKMKICNEFEYSSKTIYSSKAVDISAEIDTSEKAGSKLYFSDQDVRLIEKAREEYGKDLQFNLPIINIKRFDD